MWSKDEFGSRPMDYYREEIELTNEGNNLPEIWITEDRVMRYGPYMIPTGRHPADIGFPTQEACEAFRSQHPEYTKPQERCRLMRYRPAPPRGDSTR